MQKRVPIICDRCRAEGVRGEENFKHLPRDVLDFDPVPRRYRHDGWTPERQRAFIKALAATGSVIHAAKAVNMSPEGAYYLRRQPGAESFAKAWAAALDHGTDVLLDVTMDRAIHGTPVPIMYKGEQVAERRVYNDRLAMFHLRHRLPARYGPLKPPGGGTKSRQTLERELKQADEERAEEIRAELLARHEEWMAKLIALYAGRVGMERRCRLEGDVVGADFYLRQLTHMEVLLELGGGGKHLLVMANGGCDHAPGNDMSEAITATELTERLDALRRQAWEAAGEPPRPSLPPGRRLPDATETFHGAGSPSQRDARIKAAKAKAAEAQRLWEEAAREISEAQQPRDKGAGA